MYLVQWRCSFFLWSLASSLLMFFREIKSCRRRRWWTSCLVRRQLLKHKEKGIEFHKKNKKKGKKRKGMTRGNKYLVNPTEK